MRAELASLEAKLNYRFAGQLPAASYRRWSVAPWPPGPGGCRFRAGVARWIARSGRRGRPRPAGAPDLPAWKTARRVSLAARLHVAQFIHGAEVRDGQPRIDFGHRGADLPVEVGRRAAGADHP